MKYDNGMTEKVEKEVRVMGFHNKKSRKLTRTCGLIAF